MRRVHRIGRLTAPALACAGVLLLLAGAPAALAEDVPAAPPAAAAEVAPAVPAEAATEHATEEGAVEQNAAPSSVMPGIGYGSEPSMCPHHRGKAELPSV